jgi:hypothetical protein
METADFFGQRPALLLFNFKETPHLNDRNAFLKRA